MTSIICQCDRLAYQQNRRTKCNEWTRWFLVSPYTPNFSWSWSDPTCVTSHVLGHTWPISWFITPLLLRVQCHYPGWDCQFKSTANCITYDNNSNDDSCSSTIYETYQWKCICDFISHKSEVNFWQVSKIYWCNKSWLVWADTLCWRRTAIIVSPLGSLLERPYGDYNVSGARLTRT